MNKELAIKWVAELRSGKWPQGRGFLNHEGRFCCLGVLCEIMVEEGLADRYQVGSHTVTYWEKGMQGDETWTAYPVPSLQKLAAVDPGPNETGFTVTYKGQRVDVYVLNDRHRLSFAEIADIIEKEWILGN